MKQLTGVDLSFLLMEESGTTYGHVNGLSIYERPPGEFDPFTAVRERFRLMVGHLEPLRRKLVEVPFGLDRPYWIEDDDFDLDYHVRHIGLAPPGADDQLAEQVARIVGRAMDRSRPLWEAYVIEGLADGRWALLQKTHHATIDGASGVIMLKMFTDEARDAVSKLAEVEWTGEQPPPAGELLRQALTNLALNPVRGARLSLGILRDVAQAAGLESVGDAAQRARSSLAALTDPTAAPDASATVRLPISPAPATPWNRSISPHRRFAMRSASLENLKRLKEATGGTLNDVVMAICAGALREYLLEHDALPDGPLRAMVPVSIRTGNEEDPWTNRVSAIVADLPTDAADPVERVARCRVAMDAAKAQFELIPADALGQVADYASPVVAASAIRLVSRLRLADRVDPAVNVVITNVPGPRQPLYFAGARLDAYIPVSTISDGVGLNITVHSYVDRLDFGLISDRYLVPDLWHLVDLHIAEIDRLFEATGATRAVPPTPPGMRRGGDRVEPVPAPEPAPELAPEPEPASELAPERAPRRERARPATPRRTAGATASDTSAGGARRSAPRTRSSGTTGTP